MSNARLRPHTRLLLWSRGQFSVRTRKDSTGVKPAGARHKCWEVPISARHVNEWLTHADMRLRDLAEKRVVVGVYFERTYKAMLVGMAKSTAERAWSGNASLRARQEAAGGIPAFVPHRLSISKESQHMHAMSWEAEVEDAYGACFAAECCVRAGGYSSMTARSLGRSFL